MNTKADSYMWIQIEKPYIALNPDTLNSAYNKKKYAEILLCYRWLFVKGNVFIGERGIFGVEIFLHYR